MARSRAELEPLFQKGKLELELRLYNNQCPSRVRYGGVIKKSEKLEKLPKNRGQNVLFTTYNLYISAKSLFLLNVPIRIRNIM